MFKGLNFSVDKVVGSTFGLVIGNFGGSGQETLSSSKIDTIFVEMYRRDEPYFMGATMGNETPELPITFVSLNGEVDRQKLSHIKKNLFNELTPVTLKILQDDLSNVSFEGIFGKSDPVTLGNGIYGIDTTFKMIKNFAVEGVKTRPLTNIFFNTSDSPRGLKPIIQFKMGASGGDFSITNETNGIVMKFTSLNGGEIITVDCDRQMIQSNLGLRRLGNFNKGWMKFEQGKNVLTFQGTVTDLKVTYQNKKLVG